MGYYKVKENTELSKLIHSLTRKVNAWQSEEFKKELCKLPGVLGDINTALWCPYHLAVNIKDSDKIVPDFLEKDFEDDIVYVKESSELNKEYKKLCEKHNLKSVLEYVLINEMLYDIKGSAERLDMLILNNGIGLLDITSTINNECIENSSYEEFIKLLNINKELVGISI